MSANLSYRGSHAHCEIESAFLVWKSPCSLPWIILKMPSGIFHGFRPQAQVFRSFFRRVWTAALSRLLGLADQRDQDFAERFAPAGGGRRWCPGRGGSGGGGVGGQHHRRRINGLFAEGPLDVALESTGDNGTIRGIEGNAGQR